MVMEMVWGGDGSCYTNMRFNLMLQNDEWSSSMLRRVSCSAQQLFVFPCVFRWWNDESVVGLWCCVEMEWKRLVEICKKRGTRSTPCVWVCRFPPYICKSSNATFKCLSIWCANRCYLMTSRHHTNQTVLKSPKATETQAHTCVGDVNMYVCMYVCVICVCACVHTISHFHAATAIGVNTRGTRKRALVHADYVLQNGARSQHILTDRHTHDNRKKNPCGTRKGFLLTRARASFYLHFLSFDCGDRVGGRVICGCGFGLDDTLTRHSLLRFAIRTRTLLASCTFCATRAHVLYAYMCKCICAQMYVVWPVVLWSGCAGSLVVCVCVFMCVTTYLSHI